MHTLRGRERTEAYTACVRTGASTPPGSVLPARARHRAPDSGRYVSVVLAAVASRAHVCLLEHNRCRWCRRGTAPFSSVSGREVVHALRRTCGLVYRLWRSPPPAVPCHAAPCGVAMRALREQASRMQIVPTNKTVAREDFNDVVFRNVKGKWKAVTTEITRMHKTGRPVLVGTTSVETSELVSSFLSDAGIPHEVLNAKPENVERESEIVAQSGRRNAVTIATNMAGRGTDIILGGNAEFMARLKLREFLFPQARFLPPRTLLAVS